MPEELEPELPLDLPPEDAAMDRGYKPEWEAQSVRLFLGWKADVDAAAHQKTILKTDAMKGFKDLPEDLTRRFSYLGRTLPSETIGLASKLAAEFVSGNPVNEWMDTGFVEDLRKKSEREVNHMTSFLDEMETAGIVCKHCRHNVPGLQAIVSAHCLIGIVGRWLKDVPRMGRALTLIKSGTLTAAQQQHHPSQP